MLRHAHRSSRTSAQVLLLCALAHIGEAQCELTKVQASDGYDLDTFGAAVAIEGTRAVVGSWIESTWFAPLGQAYVLEQTSHGWVATVTLTVPGGADTGFGAAVDMLGDTIVVGAPFDDEGGADCGAVHVFELVAGTWTQTAKLFPAIQPTQRNTGASLDLSSGRLVVGAPSYLNSISGGVAYVFEPNGSTWSLTDTIWSTDTIDGDEFGHAVAQSEDHVLIGAASGGTPGTIEGAAYLFEHDGGAWNEIQELSAAMPFNQVYFGWSVALDGDRAAIGALGGIGPGIVEIFEPIAGVWTRTAELQAATPAIGDHFGRSMDLVGDRLVVGAPNSDEGCPATGNCDSGSAHVFEFDGAAWQQTAELFSTPLVKYSRFGWSVRFAGDRLLVGQPGSDAGVFGPAVQGSVRLISLPAGFDEYGAGTVGASGAAPVLSGRGCPSPAATIALTIADGPALAPGLLGISLAPAAIPFAGGELLIALPATSIPYVLDDAGEFGLTLKMPADASITGLSQYLQAGHLDAAAPAGIALTAGLIATFG